ncbi:hypothetical protein M9Y10_034050 [Tritrichomonas musculus]|uniref:Rab-GAP TBC domain-containing protein n=1 Tax=Tritrichomonas musculus TaxID=1915356 RepID=A0ABR2KDV5_9EUKA
MYDEGSAVSQVRSQFLRLGKEKITIDFNSQKLKGMLRKYYSYPVDHRKQIWEILLQIPRNKDAYEELLSKPKLPQAARLVEQKQCKKRIVPIINSLIHWHAALLNCDWLPLFVQKLDNTFGNDPLFVFEVTLTFLLNYFGEWLSEFPGPPPEILSRIDAIFTNYDPILRDGLGSGLVAWPVYRSCFAEILYDRSWLEMMDVVFSSNPQFYEFLVVAWLIFNSRQLRVDHQTFHKAQRPIDLGSVVKIAQKILAFTPTNVLAHAYFQPLQQGRYPLIEASADCVALRTLQSDNDKLIILQNQLKEERRKTDAAELTKKRRDETYSAISNLIESRDNIERIETAKAAGELNQIMGRLRLEGKRMKQCEERDFLDNWIHDWNKGVNMTMSTLPIRSEDDIEDEIVSQQDIRMQSMSNLRQADRMVRESRKVSVTRAKHARGEIEAHLHKTQIQNELAELSEKPDVLLKLNSL